MSYGFAPCRNSQFNQLMEAATSFPAEPFDQPWLLNALRSLNLQTRITPEAALEMARFVEAVARRDESLGHSK